jgi:hypothetical protein
MKNNISEELSYSKYLLNYKRGLVISEQATVTTSSTTSPVEKIPEEENFEKTVENTIFNICKQFQNKCQPCGKMMKQLKIGNLKENQVENCLSCKLKTGESYIKCDKLKGQILAEAMKLSSQSPKKGAREQATMWTALGSSLLMLYKEIKTLFQKENTGQL